MIKKRQINNNTNKKRPVAPKSQIHNEKLITSCSTFKKKVYLNTKKAK